MSVDLEAEEGRPPPAPSEEPLLDCTSSSDDGRLDCALRRLELFLSLLGFNQSSSVFNLLLCCLVFLVLGLAVPIASVYLTRCLDGGCEVYEVRKFELWVVVSQVVLAVVSIACISVDLRRHGLRMFLFVDHDQGKMEKFQDQYLKKIQDFFHILLWYIPPCLIVNIIREVIRSLYSPQNSLWISISTPLASVLGWSYLTTIFLSACALFNLACNFQIIHFEDFGRQFEREKDLTPFLEEHFFLRNCLSRISHRFRIYLLLAFLVVSASEVLTLFLTTGYRGTINFINAGGVAVSSVVQIVGIILCLYSASKISHRAQAIASLAGKWNAVITCATNDPSEARLVNNEFVNSCNTPPETNYSESDSESLDNAAVQVNTQMAFSLSSYHKRQSLGKPWRYHHLWVHRGSSIDHHDHLLRALPCPLRTWKNHRLGQQLGYTRYSFSWNPSN